MTEIILESAGSPDASLWRPPPWCFTLFSCLCSLDEGKDGGVFSVPWRSLSFLSFSSLSDDKVEELSICFPLVSNVSLLLFIFFLPVSFLFFISFYCVFWWGVIGHFVRTPSRTVTQHDECDSRINLSLRLPLPLPLLDELIVTHIRLWSDSLFSSWWIDWVQVCRPHVPTCSHMFLFPHSFSYPEAPLKPIRTFPPLAYSTHFYPISISLFVSVQQENHRRPNTVPRTVTAQV